MELPWKEPCSRCTDEPMPLVAMCDAPPSDSHEESVVADVGDPFADVIYGEALDPSEPSSVDEVHRISQSSGVVHHLAEPPANVVGRQSCKRRRLLTKRSSEEGSASVSVQFVPRAPGDPVYKDTIKQQKLAGTFREPPPLAPAVPACVGTTTQMTLQRFATPAVADNAGSGSGRPLTV